MTADWLYRCLEQRFDGEIPDHLRRLALAGGRLAFDGAVRRSASRSCDVQALLLRRNAADGRCEAPGLHLWRGHGVVHAQG